MRSSKRQTGGSRSGFTLIECLVYIAVSVVLMGVATLALYRCLDNMRSMRTNADDIQRAMHAGELWRHDIRSATGPVQCDQGGRLVEIPQARGEISYKFVGAQVLRRVRTGARWSVFLSKVQHSQMTTDPRQHVHAWRWEVELQPTSRSNVHVFPLFTFFAVPTAANQP